MKPSQYIGEPGCEISAIALTLLKVMDWSKEDEEYERWFHQLQDEWGNIFVWVGGQRLHYADSPEAKGELVKPGECINVECKIKSHDTYNGTKQTRISHVREVQTPEQRKALLAHQKGQKRAGLVALGICPGCKGIGIKRGKICKECGGW